MRRPILTICAALVLAFGLSVFAFAQNRPGGGGGGKPGGGGGGGGQASAPRGGGQSGGSGQTAAPRGGGQVSAPRGGSSATAPAPSQARPRGATAGSGGVASGRPPSRGPIYGTAALRSSVTYGRIILPNRYYVSPYYYSPYAFGAFGLGFWGYDPYWWGGYWGSPYGYPYGGWGWGSPYWGYGGYGGYGYGYDYGYEPGYSDRGSSYAAGYGSLKLKVQPSNAEVYVDGYYMGQVDDFNGMFQHLDLEGGTHRIELRAEGYQPLVLEMKIEPGRTVTYENRLRRNQ